MGSWELPPGGASKLVANRLHSLSLARFTHCFAWDHLNNRELMGFSWEYPKFGNPKQNDKNKTNGKFE